MSSSGSKLHALPVFESPGETRIRTWLQMVRVFSVVGRLVSSTLGELGMTLPQFELLATLRFGEGVTQKELAERLLVTKGNVCGLLDRLENLGWVERRTDAKDNRINRLYLTPAGRRKFDHALPQHDQTVLATMSELSDGEVKHLRSSLEKLEARANAI